LFSNVLAKGAHLADHKKNAAFAQWGEHPISGMARQTVQIPIIKEIDNPVPADTIMAQTLVTFNEVLDYKAVAKKNAAKRRNYP
jgi:hypothetical protein